MSGSDLSHIDAFRRALDVRPGVLTGPFAPECVYHYTTAYGFSGILDNHAIRATNFSFLNDSSEVEFGRKMIDTYLNERSRDGSITAKRFVAAILRHLDNEAITEVYVACFTGLDDDLSQWRAYGMASAERYAIGFDAKKLGALAAADGNAAYARVLYDRPEQNEYVTYLVDKALRLFERTPSAIDARDQYAAITSRRLARLLPLLKDGAYKAETEWRLILWRNRGSHDPQFDVSRNVLRPYVLVKLGVPAPIVDLCVLAPTRSERACKAATMRLEAAKVRVKARPSTIPFAD